MTPTAPGESVPDAAAVCRRFSLGEPVSGWSAVEGGRSHRMWSLTTTTGRYAVKAFDQTVDHASGPQWRQWLREAVAIELAGRRAAVPAPRPIPIAGTADRMLAEVPAGDTKAVVRVHEWVEGTRVADDTADPDLASQIGGILARLHALPPIRERDLPVGLWETADDTELAALVRRARERGHAWAEDLDQIRPLWGQVRESARRDTGKWPVIATHRDLGPKNVLVTEAGPVVLDWDVAGPWTAVAETASAALEWAGVLTGAPDRECVAALLSAYRAEGGRFSVADAAPLSGWLIKNANWVHMHIRHALDDSAPRQATGLERVAGLLSDLRRYIEGLPQWTQWLGSGAG